MYITVLPHETIMLSVDGLHVVLMEYEQRMLLQWLMSNRKAPTPAAPHYSAMLAESLTDEQARKLLMFFARNKTHLFKEIVCPACKSEEAATIRNQTLDEFKAMYVQALFDPNISDCEIKTLKMVDCWVESLRTPSTQETQK